MRGRGPIEHICGASAATRMVNETCVRVFLVKNFFFENCKAGRVFRDEEMDWTEDIFAFK